MRVERRHQRLIVEAAYAAWAARELSTVAACVHDNAEWLVHVPSGAWPLHGAIRGKSRIMQSLRGIVRDFEVLEYRPLKIVQLDGIWASRARIHYGHRATGLSYEATISNLWHIERDKIRRFEAFHDAARLRAFYEMVSRIGIEA
jgi:ketosteroid isomerase-like protein